MLQHHTAWKMIISAMLVLVSITSGVASDRKRGGDSGRAIKVVPETSVTQGRTALVIGNAAYENSPLKNAVSDAIDIAAALRQMGFVVIEHRDVNLRTMMEALEIFNRQLRQSKVGLFYFAGHGMQINGENYLIPLAARINREQEVPFEALPVGRVLGVMQDAATETNIIILDACRNNPYARSFRSGQQGLAAVQAINGSLIAYATAPGAVAADGEGRNGVYTAHLLRNMQLPGVPVEQVLKNVRIGVQQDTKGQQTPWESSSLTRDFAFVTAGAQGSVTLPMPPASPPTSSTTVAALPEPPPASLPVVTSGPPPATPPADAAVTTEGLAIVRQEQVQVARQLAIQEAHVKAIQQVIEQQVGPTTANQRYVEIDRHIYNQAQRYVLRSHPLNEWREGNKLRAQVEVMLDTGKLSQDLAAMGLAGTQSLSQSARVLVLIAETHSGRVLTDSASEMAIVRELLNHGFRVVAVEQSSGLRSSPQGRQALTGDTRALRSLGQQYGAELLIVGSASSQIAMAGKQLGGLISARAHLDAKAVHVATTDILVADGQDASGLDIAGDSAGKKALAEVGKKWVEQHLDTLMKWR